MKILHLNTAYNIGGAARSANRLHRGLLSMGLESRMLVQHCQHADSSIICLRPDVRLRSKLGRYLKQKIITRDYRKYIHTRPPGVSWFSDDRSINGKDIIHHLPNFDIINLHWIAGLVDYREFFNSIPTNIPIVWRLSDMNPFTGGCHYSEGCDKYNQACGKCPQLGSRDENDLTRQIWNRKASVFRKVNPKRLHIIAQSKWMAAEISASVMLGKFDCTIIPNGIDTKLFSPKNKMMVRESLGLPKDKKIVFFLAEDLDINYKGAKYLLKAFTHLKNKRDYILLTAGRGKPKISKDISFYHVGDVNNDLFLSLLYNSSDIFVIPSLHDNLPNTVLESMACGTPVVGFNTGGIPDMISDGINGRLVETKDFLSLSMAITDTLANDEKRVEMGKNCRALAEKRYSIDVISRRYKKFYEGLDNKRH